MGDNERPESHNEIPVELEEASINPRFRQDTFVISKRADSASESAVNSRRGLLRKSTAGSNRSGTFLHPVVISYEQKYHEYVVLLEHHLELNGFACAPINESTDEVEWTQLIDDASFLILCMSRTFSLESSCADQALYANGAKKLVIPICLEKVAWPPAGPLLNMLEEKLFLRFYHRSTDKRSKVDDGFYWPGKKFQDLIGYLTEMVSPNKKVRAAAIKRPIPPLPDSLLDAEKDETHPPQVFLSYQWKHQQEVGELKEFLESSGISTAVSSGEISATANSKLSNDEAVKSCSIVLLCLNTLYPHSKQCTKEVFQARGMKKTIIVLLLEPLQYPPNGKQEYILKKYQPLPFFRGYKRKFNETSWPGCRYLTLIRKISESGSVNISDGTSKSLSEQHQAERPASPLSQSKRYDVIISCSPCSTEFSESLASELCHSGYAVGIGNYASDSLNNFKFKAVLCVLSKRYCNSSMAANEMTHASMKIAPKTVVPILVERDQEYPPKGPMARILQTVKPINCTIISAGLRQWKGSIQFQHILDRLENHVNSADYENEPQRLPTIKKRPFTAPGEVLWREERQRLKHRVDKEMKNNHKLPQLPSGRDKNEGEEKETTQDASSSRLPVVAE